jgi:hypothetical protein
MAAVRRFFTVTSSCLSAFRLDIRTSPWDFSPDTLRIERERGLAYVSSRMADDDPYKPVERGEPTGILEFPLEWIRDDAVYFNMHRFNGLQPQMPTSAVYDIFRREFERAFAEGAFSSSPCLCQGSERVILRLFQAYIQNSL